MSERPFEIMVTIKMHEFGIPEKHAGKTMDRLADALLMFGDHEVLDWYWREPQNAEAGRDRQEDQGDGEGDPGGALAVRTALAPAGVRGGDSADPAVHAPGIGVPHSHDQPGGNDRERVDQQHSQREQLYHQPLTGGLMEDVIPGTPQETPPDPNPDPQPAPPAPDPPAPDPNPPADPEAEQTAQPEAPNAVDEPAGDGTETG